MDTLKSALSAERTLPYALATPRVASTKPYIPAPMVARPPATRPEGAGESLPALLAGLEANFQDDVPFSEKAETLTENVSTPTNQAATLTQTVSQGKPAEKLAEVAGKVGGGSSSEATGKALQGLGKAGEKVGKLGESAFVVSKPFSIANNVKTLATAETGEEKATAATGLASDVGYTARAAGAAAEGGSGVSKLATIASAQGKLAEAAPKVAGVAAKVGKAAPVIGGVAGVVSGGLDIKDAVTKGEVDKPKLATGALKVASGVALAIPGGLPVAMGLGAASLVIEQRENIVKGVKAVGGGIKKGAEVVADGAKKVLGLGD